jgi:iron complex transport system substrate-binding protein
MIKIIIIFALLFGLFACKNTPSKLVDEAPLVSSSHKDATGTSIHFDLPPKRIISLNESLTELAFDLGAGERIIAVSEDTEIKWDGKPVPTLPYPSQPDAIADSAKKLNPDIIFALKEQFQNPSTFRDKAKPIPVFFCEMKRMDDVYKTVQILGDYTNHSTEAGTWVKQFKQFVADIEADREATKPSCVIIASYDPLHVIGNDNYLNDILTSCGGKNAFAHKGNGLIAITMEELLRVQPKYAFLITDNENVSQDLLKAQPSIKNLKALKEERMLTLDPAVFLRPGMRLFQAYAYLASYLNPKMDVRKLYQKAFPQNEVVD